MNDAIGSKGWVIGEGYIPETSTHPAPTMTSHETACILDAGDRDATVQITAYFVVVQHPRLDSRQSENALMTTIAYAVT